MDLLKVRHESFAVDHKSDPMPDVFYKQSSDCNFAISNALEYINSADVISEINAAKQTLLIACELIGDAAVIQALQKKADNGVRIYLLIGNEKSSQSAIDALSGRCLIRSGVSQRGALLLIDHATNQPRGLLLMDHQALVEPQENTWAILLEPQQREDSLRSFCKLFWDQASHEYVLQNQPQQTVAHPDGEIVTNHSHQLCATLRDCLSETLSQLTGASNFVPETENASCQVLLTSDTAQIAQHARHGMALTERSIPTLLLSNDSDWLLPQFPDFNCANWCLKLSDAQSQQLKTAYKQAVVDAAWQYKSGAEIGQFESGQKIRFADQPHVTQTMKSARNHSLEAINTDHIDSFINDSVRSLAQNATGWQRDLLAHQVDYEVIIHPPYCPTNAKKDALYEEWLNAELVWKEQITLLERKQQTIDEQQAGIAERFKGFLKGFLLGQGQSVKQLNQDLQTLKGWSVTRATPAEREDYKARLEDLQTRINQRDMDTTEKLNEAEQYQKWESERLHLEQEQARKKEVSTAAMDKKAQVVKYELELKQQAERDFSKAWAVAVNTLSDKQLEDSSINNLQPEQFLPDILPSDKEAQEQLLASANIECVQQKRKALSVMTVEQAEQWKVCYKDKIWKKHYRTFDAALESYRLALQKIERDIQDAEKLVKNSQIELENAKARLAAHGHQFVFQPKTDKAFDQQLGIKDKTHQLMTYSWPNSELPIAGIELRNYKNERYLVVFKKSQLEQARKDAERLKSKIVCDKELINA